MNIYDSIVTIVELGPLETLIVIIGLLTGAYIIYDVVWRIRVTRQVYRDELNTILKVCDKEEKA